MNQQGEYRNGTTSTQQQKVEYIGRTRVVLANSYRGIASPFFEVWPGPASLLPELPTTLGITIDAGGST